MNKMDVRVFIQYQKMCYYTMHRPLLCKNDPKHPPLYVRLEKDDNFCLKCAGCEYVLKPGLSLYRQLKTSIEFYEGRKFDWDEE